MMHTIAQSFEEAVFTRKSTDTAKTTTGVMALIIWMKLTVKRWEDPGWRPSEKRCAGVTPT